MIRRVDMSIAEHTHKLPAEEAEGPRFPMVIELDTDHLRITPTISGGLSLARHNIDGIMDAATEKGCRKVLFDARNGSTTPTTMDCYHLAEGIADRRERSSFCMAVVVHEEQMNAAGFAETVAKNRGVFLQVFFSEAKAIGWLRSLS